MRPIFRVIAAASFLAAALIAGITPVSGAATSKASLPLSINASTKLVACWQIHVAKCPASPRGRISACAVGGRGKDFLRSNGCPVTDRFRTRVLKLLGQSSSTDPTCRCQKYPKKITFKAGSSTVIPYDRAAASGIQATVKVNYWFTKKHPVVIVYVSVHQDKSWLVTNTYCAGATGTTIYKSPVKACKPKK